MAAAIKVSPSVYSWPYVTSASREFGGRRGAQAGGRGNKSTAELGLVGFLSKIKERNYRIMY